jgi:isocitrate lyase
MTRPTGHRGRRAHPHLPEGRGAQAGIFHHLITLPTYHTAALSTDNLAKEYFGEAGMLGYVKGVQRKEIRQGIACVKHQNMAGSTSATITRNTLPVKPR